jgi:PPK2 family polyphosphate:nucleotide phosphotransferase
MDRYRVKPESKVVLENYDPGDKSAFEGNKSDAKKHLIKLSHELFDLQEKLYAEHKHSLLIVLQALDTGGKDGTIRHVFTGLNPQGVRVANFKVPTPLESGHDYLWRVHKQTPEQGEIVIFNRSHYEDVLVVRVHELVPKEVWSRRYDQINDFERTLTEEGTTILKFYLHIDLAEQKKRLQARLDDPTKHWKFQIGDLKERALWSKYMRAYEDVFNKTSTRWAPWYIVPANRKWYRNLIIATIISDTIKGLKSTYPTEDEGLKKVVIE